MINLLVVTVHVKHTYVYARNILKGVVVDPKRSKRIYLGLMKTGFI